MAVFARAKRFRHLFESVLQRCMTEGLVRGEGFATDASIIKADAQRQRGVPACEPIDWGNPEAAARPVREYLAGLEEENSSGTPPKAISLTDPAATWTAAPSGPAFCRARLEVPRRPAEEPHRSAAGILPALDSLDPTLPTEALLSAAVEANVRWTMRKLLESPEGKARAAQGEIKLVGALYDLDTGRVRFLE